MKHFKQETRYTCGPACMRMILSSLKIKKSEKNLVKLLKTSRRHGTNHDEFPKLAEKLKLDYIIGRENSTIKELKSVIKQRFQIIVCYYLPEEKTGHYAVVEKITSTNIYLLDPHYGSNHKIPLKQFIRNWHGTYTYRGWYFGVKK